MNRVQDAICTAVSGIGLTLAEASLQIGLHERFLPNYVAVPSPGELSPDVQRALSRLTGLPEFVFRGSESTVSALDTDEEQSGLFEWERALGSGARR